MVLEKTLESRLDSEEIKPVRPKGDQPCILMVKLQYFGHLVERANSLEKTLMLGDRKDREAWHAAGHGIESDAT